MYQCLWSREGGTNEHPPLSLDPHHAQQLKANTPDIIAERGYGTAQDLATLITVDGHLASYQQRVPALVIPVYKLGFPSPYTVVIRPDQPRTQLRKGKQRTVKYEWPAAKPVCLDVLPRFRPDLKNTSLPLWFTERAKKADALASLNRGIMPISLNGVWG
jgi:tRNA A37 threonylcarbamoyladenosine synthetase subunit TsaC/SUA5/YrdC